MSVEDVLNEAHKYQTTQTVFLAACSSAHSAKNGRREKMRPVVLTVPVNLRQYYEIAHSAKFLQQYKYRLPFRAGPMIWQPLSRQ
jgi:hypothetical protein